MNIFTQHRDPEGALVWLKELMPEGAVTFYEDGQWETVAGTWKQGWLKKPLVLTVRHNPDYYAGEKWPLQLAGMTRYLRDFENSERRPDLFGYLPGLSFVLSFIFEPEPVDDDPREAVVFAMAERMQGVMFMPNFLADSQGRVIVSAGGEPPPEAELPAHVPFHGEPDAGLAEAGADEDEQPCEPPAAERVAARLKLMVALVWRGFVEQDMREGLEEQWLTLLSDLRESPAWQEA